MLLMVSWTKKTESQPTYKPTRSKRVNNSLKTTGVSYTILHAEILNSF